MSGKGNRGGGRKHFKKNRHTSSKGVRFERSQKNANFRNQANFKNREKNKLDARVTIQFDPGKVSSKKAKHKFTLYGDDEKVTVVTEDYVGSKESGRLLMNMIYSQ